MPNNIIDRKRISRKERIIYAVFAYMILMFLMVSLYKGGQKEHDNVRITFAKVSGEYSVDDGTTFLDFSKYKSVYHPMSTSMIFKGHITDPIEAGELIWLHVENLDVRMYLNDEQVYSNEALSEYVVWDSLISPGIETGDEIRIEMKADYELLFNAKYSKLLKNIAVGPRDGLIGYNIDANILYLSLTFFILMVGFMMVPYCFELRFLQGESANTSGMMSCAFMLVFGSLNCMMNHDYIGLIFDNLYFMTMLDYTIKMLTSVFMVRYISNYLHRDEFKRVFKIFEYINITRVILFLVNTMMTGDDRIARILFAITSMLGFVVLLASLITLIVDFASGTKEDWLVTIAIIAMTLFFLVEVLFFVLCGSYITKMLTLGIVVFAIAEWVSVTQKNIYNIKLADKAKELENELTQSQVKMMISQMQPHFLYNALGTIRALCIKEPQTARQAIDSFSKYLRANMDSLNQKGCIPFSKELEHTRCYLFIEQLRFGEMLKVEYDIETEDFEIPPLSLQTMAENAVKHGLLARKNGGTLKISTRESTSCYEVHIEDDGVGFDVNKPLNAERSHLGVVNTRQRIIAMCGGSVSIGSRPGKGTTITIVIPKNYEKQE